VNPVARPDQERSLRAALFFYLFPASIVLTKPAAKMILLALRPISSGNLAVHCGQRRERQILANPADGARKR
jgi:hypothetical protein